MNNSLILGFFDSVHLAHQTVIRSATDVSSDTILITLKNFNKPDGRILSRKNSLEKIKSLGVKEIVELDFQKIAAMPALNFIKYLVQNYSPVSISTGYDYTFGHNKSGNPELLDRMQHDFGYKYICIPQQTNNGEVISSTLIKNYLKNGNIERANRLLGSSFILEGIVIYGAQIGRTIGFPTANINYPEEIVKIPYGVYQASISGKKAILNWGMKPTVHNTSGPVVEVHIPDFEGDLYGQNIKINILKRIRAEKKFSSLNELKTQINKDIEECLK